jgi:hypothetical protein
LSRISQTFAIFLTLAIIMSCLYVLMVKPANALNSTLFLFDSTSVYGIDGYGVNLTCIINEPVFQTNSTIMSFKLQVLEPFNARGILVNPTDYDISRKSLNFYLKAGVLVDYDRSALIDILWSNWGDTSNATYVKEENKLYFQNIWANMTKLDDSYIGTAVLPTLQGNHNATFWIRAEQDQVTTSIPFWAAFPRSITINNQAVSPSPTIPELSWLAILPLLVGLFSVAVMLSYRKTARSNQ